MEGFRNYYSEKEVVGLTQELVRIPSHKDVEGREKAVSEFIYKFCKDLGLDVEYQEVDGARKNVLVRLNGQGGGKILLFNGHMDTVPPYEMIIDPYEAKIEDGFVWGRGTSDMKGPIASMLIAMLAIKRSGRKMKGNILFTGVLGEEEQSEGTEALVKAGIQAHGAVVGEPSNYEYAIGHRGLEWIEIKLIGKMAHGGVPHLGINAISKAAKLILRIEEKLMPKIALRDNEYMGPSVMNFGKITGGTQPSTVADTCSIQIDRRYIPGEDVASVYKELQDIVDELKAEDPQFDAQIIRMENNFLTLDHIYLTTDPQEAIVQATKKALKEVTGEEAQITRRRGWTDAALLSHFAGIPTVITGPGNISYSHTKDERVAISHLVDYVEIYCRIAQEFCEIE